jgi:hypothetical protein
MSLVTRLACLSVKRSLPCGFGRQEEEEEEVSVLQRRWRLGSLSDAVLGANLNIREEVAPLELLENHDDLMVRLIKVEHLGGGVQRLIIGNGQERSRRQDSMKEGYSTAT